MKGGGELVILGEVCIKSCGIHYRTLFPNLDGGILLYLVD